MTSDLMTRLRKLNETAELNRWAGFEVVDAAPAKCCCACHAAPSSASTPGICMPV